MKKLLFFSLLFCVFAGLRHNCFAQGLDSLSFQHWAKEVNTNIVLTTEKVTQLIFPAPIEKWRGGFNTEIFVQEVYNNILYLQPLMEFPSSNLHVITTDGANYTINIRYASSIKRTTYIYSVAEATVPPLAALHAKSTVKQETPQSSQPERTEIILPKHEKSTINKVLQEKDFIVNRSGVRYQNLQFRIAAIYFHNDQLFFKCKVKNGSNIPYEFDYIGFTMETKKRRKTTTANTEIITPQDTYYESTSVTAGKEITCVFALKKFTIGDDHTLVISIVEKDGARNMNLNISDEILLLARNI